MQDADLEPMLGPSETPGKLAPFVDRMAKEFGYVDDEIAGFWHKKDGGYPGP